MESNGDLKLVISNSEKQHNGIINGKPLPERERQAGLIFFNSAGDECGGLVYDGNDAEAGLVLSVDKYRDDQVMQLQYIENTAKTREGMVCSFGITGRRMDLRRGVKLSRKFRQWKAAVKGRMPMRG